MIEFSFKELLKKHKMSRYQFRKYTNLDTRRVNAYYFGTVKNVKVSELDTICELLNCDTCDLIHYKPGKKKNRKSIGTD